MRIATTAVLVAGCLVGSYATAGTVELTPSDQTVPPTGTATIELSVLTTIDRLVGIDSTDIVVGSDLPIVSFTYNTPNAFATTYTPAPSGIYTHNLWIGASNAGLLAAGVFPATLGTLVVNVDGASPGDYTVWVDTSQDNCSGLGATVLDKLEQPMLVSEPLLGSAMIHVSESGLVSSNYACNQSLTRTQNHVLRLTFSGNVTAPTPGAGELIICELQNSDGCGTDLSGSFSFTVQNGNTLRIVENGTVLQNETWYGVMNTGGWAGAPNFEMDYVVVRGDVSNNGRTQFADLSEINQNLTNTAADDDVYDIDANGRVQFADISAANLSMNSQAPDPKPTGHVCTLP